MDKPSPWPVAMYRRIAEPRVQRITYLIVYLLHAVGGIGVLWSDPTSITYVLGRWPAVIWGCLLVVGGVFGAVAVLPGWNYIERIGIFGITIGVGMASLLLWASPPGGVALLLWSLVTGWLAIFLYRAWEIRGYTVAPKA